MRHTLALIIVLCATLPGVADVKMPAIFSEHMVLQAGKELPVWGWADAGEKVTVSIAGQSRTITTPKDGRWKTKLDPIAKGEGLTMTVKGRNTVTITDVLVGEVWLCSGQSNMGFTVGRANNFEAEQKAANFPKLRMFFQGDGPEVAPKEEGRGKWAVCTPETVGGFSATAYFFGREVHQKLGVPVGLINSSVGGTAIEAWTSMDVQKDRADLRRVFEPWEKAIAAYDPVKAQAAYEKAEALHKLAAAKAKKENKPAPRGPQKPGEPRKSSNYPANLYNGKIVPLIGYAIRGAIWYQGESNAKIGDLYEKQLTLMIDDWRTRWGQGDFHFAWVQLPNFHAKVTEPVTDSGWVMVREGMLKSLKVPNTGMAITTELGEAGDIHPKNKQDVGKRLAMWALADVYGKGGESMGPIIAAHSVRGAEVIVKFDHAADGLVTQGGGELQGFAIAGSDKQWHKADARIVGHTVIVTSPLVRQPAAVRYAWVDNPDCNLYNTAGLPASPFRTDDWTVEIK